MGRETLQALQLLQLRDPPHREATQSISQQFNPSGAIRMLSVKRIRNRHYHIDLAREDYYLEGGEPPGQWYGNGAAALGLSGPVGKAALLHLMDGFSTDGRTKLVQNAGREREIGWDFTLSAPKTVSVLWSQADPRTRRTIQKLHEKAIQKPLDWLEK